MSAITHHQTLAYHLFLWVYCLKYLHQHQKRLQNHLAVSIYSSLHLGNGHQKWLYQSLIQNQTLHFVLCIVYNNYINAKGRIEARRAKTGRAVTENYAKKSYRDLTFNIPKYINLNCQNVDEIFCFDNTSSSIELIQSTNSNQRKFTPSSVSADSGTASIILTDNNTGQTFPKTYTFTKSKKGAPVTTIAASPQSQTITSGSGGIGTPTDITITVNEGGGDYGYDTAGAIPANNFRITGVTNATNNNDGTITPNTPTKMTTKVKHLTF